HFGSRCGSLYDLHRGKCASWGFDLGLGHDAAVGDAEVERHQTPGCFWTHLDTRDGLWKHLPDGDVHRYPQHILVGSDFHSFGTAERLAWYHSRHIKEKNIILAAYHKLT